MANPEVVVPTRALNYVFLVLLYAPVCLVSYRLLVPRLSPTAGRVAYGFLLTQVSAIALSLIFQSAAGFQWWLWDLNSEWNIPTIFAALQLMSIGWVALFFTLCAGKQPALLRLYLLMIALQFFFLAVDELFQFHETNRVVEDSYNALGIASVIAVILLAPVVGKRSWLWLVCMLIGLGLAWFGAIVLERYRDVCGYLGSFRLSECLEPYHYEEPLELLGVWLALVAVLGLITDAPLSRRRWRMLYLLPPLCIATLLLAVPASPFSIPALSHVPIVEFESGESLQDYRIKLTAQNVNVRLSLSPARWDFVDGLGYSIHLVDQASGDSVAHGNLYAQLDLKFTVGPSIRHVYRQEMDIAITPDVRANRATWIVLTLWRDIGGIFVRENVLSSDLPRLNETQVILDELVLPAEASAASAAPLAAFDRGIALESAVLPESARAGETLEIGFSWRSDGAGLDEYSQFLHFVHDGSGEQWGYDQAPLGGRLPTRLWYAGLADSETWRVPLSEDLAPGQYVVYTGLYMVRDLTRLAASDAGGRSWPDDRVALGSIIIE